MAAHNGDLTGDVRLTWKGTTYTIPSDQVVMAVAQVEDYLTLDELARYAASGRAPLGKLSTAYAALLRYAGASDVTDREVYQGMFSDEDEAEAAVNATQGLLRLMLPPGDFEADKDVGRQAGNLPSPTKPRAKSSSKRRTRSSSGKGG